MTNKKWAILLIAVSIPLSYYGFSNFEKGASDPLEAILISLACTGGIACLLGGIYMLFKKGRGEDLLASQTSEDSPISLALNETPEDFINKKQKVNEMAETTRTSVELMKREKELETRRKEVVAMLKEITKEETAVVEELKSKGWVQQENGEWGIG